MKIWRLLADANNYENFAIVNDEDRNFLYESDSFAGKPMADKWKPLDVKIRKKRKPGDMQALFAGIPVINERALTVLRDVIQDHVEILPLQYSKRNYYALNVLEVKDCMDYEKSEVERFHSGRIMRFEKYVFLREKLGDSDIFKILDEPRGASFVTDRFKQRVEQHSLTGFQFDELWDSERP